MTHQFNRKHPLYCTRHHPFTSPACLPPLLYAAWTQLPGMPMQDGAGEFAGKKVFCQEGGRMEFVLTNGSGKFDTPNPYGEPGRPKNYVIEEAGTWELHAGQLRRL